MNTRILFSLSGAVMAFFYLIVVTSCSKPEKKYTLADQDYINFARAVQDSIEKGNGVFLDSAFDKDEFFDRIVAGGKNETTIGDSEFKKGMKMGLYQKFSVGSEITRNMGEKGYYNFLKFYRKDNVPHIVFRLFGESGINYHDFELFENEGKIKIADCYILLTGEPLSITMHNLMMATVDSKKILGMNVNTKLNEERFEGLKKMTEVRQLMKEQKFEEASAAFQNIPEEMKKEKVFRMIELMIEMHLDQDNYLTKLEAYEKAFPDDPSLKLSMMDAFFLRKEYSKVIDCFNSLEKSYGQDPVIDFMKGNTMQMEGKYVEACGMYKKATRVYKDFESAYDNWLLCSMESKDYPEVIRLAGILEKDFGFTRSQIDIYFQMHPEFVATKEYQDWSVSQ